MNPRKIIAFFKTKTGMLILFIVVLLVGLGVVSSYTKQQKEDRAKKREGGATAPMSTVQPEALETDNYTLRRQYAPAVFGSAEEQRQMIAQQAAEREQKAKPQKSQPQQKPGPGPALQFLPLTPEKPAPATVPKEEAVSPSPLIDPKASFAPYGRLVRAKLVTTVDSSNMATPVIGLITHDLYWNNRLLIPANSELHAVAVPDRVRNRIEVNGKWVVVLASGGVYPEGSELILEGLALDMDVAPEDDKFGLTDGSAGLRGNVLTNENTWDTVKLFAATFLAGASEGLTERRTNAFGTTQIVPSLESGALQGTREVMEKYAARIMELIERDGAYVRVPAGKQFYLYIRETLQLSKARLGATLAQNVLASSEAKLATAQAEWQQAKQAEIDARREALIQQMAEQADRIRRNNQKAPTEPNPAPPKPAATTPSRK